MKNVTITTYVSNIIVIITQTLAIIKSQEFINYIKQHFITTSPLNICHQWYSKFCEMLYQNLCALRPLTFDFQLNSMLFVKTTTYISYNPL